MLGGLIWSIIGQISKMNLARSTLLVYRWEVWENKNERLEIKGGMPKLTLYGIVTSGLSSWGIADTLFETKQNKKILSQAPVLLGLWLYDNDNSYAMIVSKITL